MSEHDKKQTGHQPHAAPKTGVTHHNHDNDPPMHENHLTTLTSTVKNADGSFRANEINSLNNSYVDINTYVPVVGKNGHVEKTHERAVTSIRSDAVADAVDKLVLDLDKAKGHGKHADQKQLQEFFDTVKEAAKDKRFDATEAHNITTKANNISKNLQR